MRRVSRSPARSSFFLGICLSVVLAGLVGCGSNDAPEGNANKASRLGPRTAAGPIQVVATVGTVADLARGVGGSRVDVRQIMGTGVDPHLYRATRDDIQALSKAEIVFYSGLMLEGKMGDTLVKMSRDKPVYAVTEALDEATLLEPPEFAGHFDPHVWMDVSAWSKCAQVVADALSEFDPDHQQEYQSAAERYRSDLDRLHRYGLEALGSIPESRRVLITSHDAFNYFGRAYGLEVLGVQGISTESEAGLQRVNELVDLIVERKVAAVFVESSVSRKNILALVEGAQARDWKVEIGGELFSDAMGAEGTYEGTYLGMLDHNITLTSRALGGNAPERGMQGKLAAPEPRE